MLPRLARSAVIAAVVIVVAIVAAALLEPSLPARFQHWSTARFAAAVGGAWLALAGAIDLARARTAPRRGRSLTLPPIRRR
jgi:hypothetical protein